MAPTDNEVPADLLARISQEVPINSPYLWAERFDEKLGGETVRREVGNVVKNFRKWKAV
jgi:hypothetical protein